MKNILNLSVLVLIGAFIFLVASCSNATKNPEKETSSAKDTIESVVQPIDKTIKSVIYEVNIRQYTPEGTFKAFESHIPRLKAMNVDILWLMPIFPISEKNRKGSMGSYYAVADYKAVNPEFGTEEDLRNLIQTAHDNDMAVILDWVANHTGWDNPWITEHPEWYTKDSTDSIIVPEGTDWSDVADLNYDNQEMQTAMIDALQYWVTDFDVDGYRCDVAGMVPTDFWNDLREELNKLKPIFMLAEAEQLDLHEKAFDMGYAWNLHHVFNQIASGEKNADSLRLYFEKAEKEYPTAVYRMAFTSNHDENSWNGTVFERMPNSYEAFAALTYVIPGMPLIYSGQEAGLNKQLEFFEKDTIDWKEHEMAQLYTKLGKLKHENQALWNGVHGGEMTFIKTDKTTEIFAFTRQADENGNSITAIFNLSDKEVEFELKDAAKEYTNALTGETFTISSNKKISLNAWEYLILF
ncbi:MAG: alpha-amylase family glycosyl hydrolase [Bacteroidota bacterium]|nr:alpha-amylase family glycosyl hydrolase [Bacteroidota bacterium]